MMLKILGRKWCNNKLNDKPSTIKRPIFEKGSTKKEDDTNKNLRKKIDN